MGIINFTMDSISKHYGLVNINPKTRVDLMGFAGTNSKANIAVRFRNRSTYNIIGLGTHYMGLDENFAKISIHSVNYRISEAASVGPGFICGFPQYEEYMNLEQRVFVSGILLGGSLSDNLHIGDRDYNMGSGSSIKLQNHMDIYKYGYLDFDANYFHIFTWKGLTSQEWKKWEGATERQLDYINVQGDPGNTRVMAFNASFGFYLSHHVSLDVKGSFFMRGSHYRYYDDVKARTFELRAGLTYRM